MRVYVFDRNNNTRLDLDELLNYERNRKWVLFTNYNDNNRITKGASRVLFGCPNQRFVGPQGDTAGDNFYFEMSTRDTYGAFELDFDTPDDEQRPNGSS
jgi:hypothetical protein